jgi:VWFA-related protein
MQAKRAMRSLFALFFAGGLFAQDPGFQAQVRLVVMPVTVQDAKGRPVDGLTEANFKVFDSGVAQPFNLDTFGTGVAPVSLMVAVQTSGLSAAALVKVRQIGAMIQPLVAGERGCAGLLSFSDSVVLRQPCTRDVDALSLAFARLEPRSPQEGHLLDGASEAIRLLDARPNSRRVLLLISETRDRGSEAKLGDVIRAAQTAGVTVYAATYSAFRSGFFAKPEEVQQPRQTRPLPLPTGKPISDPVGQSIPAHTDAQATNIGGGIGELVRLGKEKTTEKLAQATGGAEFSFTRLNGLEKAIQALGEEIHAQYVISFMPKEPKPGYHALTVQVQPGAKLRVRARPGYWANVTP